MHKRENRSYDSWKPENIVMGRHINWRPLPFRFYEMLVERNCLKVLYALKSVKCYRMGLQARHSVGMRCKSTTLTIFYHAVPWHAIN